MNMNNQEPATPQPDPSSSKQPWGWKTTLHLYGTGSMPSSEAMFKAAHCAAEAVGADDFVGVDCKVVQTKPNEQIST
jgi:hypothetical protein